MSCLAPGRPAPRPCDSARRRPPGSGSGRPRWPTTGAPPPPRSPSPALLRLATARPAVPAQDASAAPTTPAPTPFQHIPPAPTLRCALCYELGFTTRAALADHLVGPAHTRHWGPLLVRAGRAAAAARGGGVGSGAAAGGGAAIACPYCGEPAPVNGPDTPAATHPMRWLRRHVSAGECGRRRRRSGGGGGGGQEEKDGAHARPDPVACFEPPPPTGAPPWVDLRDAAAFPRHAPLLSAPCPPHLAGSLGFPSTSTLTVRPLHPSRAHALATVLTAAFAGDPDPPTYAWLARELAREAARFEWEGGGGGGEGGLALGSGDLRLPTAPLPAELCRTAGGAGGGSPRWWRIGRGRVAVAEDGEGESDGPATAPPGRSGATPPATGAGPARRAASSSSLSASAAAEEEDDEWRVRLEEAWGRWLWLVAEVEVDGQPHDAHDMQSTRVLGGAALLLHDRAPALDALRRLDPPGLPSSMDFALWLTSDPSPAATAGAGGRGGWLWWAGVDPRARRAGVGRALVSAAEVAVAGFGWEALYVQALAPPPGGPDGGGLGLLAGLMGGGEGKAKKNNDPGAAARKLYARAGYTPLPPPAGSSNSGRGGLAMPWWGGGRRPAVDATAVMLGKSLGLSGGWWEE